MTRKFKPHRPAGIHPAYRVHGVAHHSKMDHHPGKTHAHPSDPHMSEAQPAMPAPGTPAHENAETPDQEAAEQTAPGGPY